MSKDDPLPAPNLPNVQRPMVQILRPEHDISELSHDLYACSPPELWQPTNFHVPDPMTEKEKQSRYQGQSSASDPKQIAYKEQWGQSRYPPGVEQANQGEDDWVPICTVISLPEESDKFRPGSYYAGPFFLQVYDKRACGVQKNPILGASWTCRIAFKYLSAKSHRKNIVEYNIRQTYIKGMAWDSSNPSIRPWGGKRPEHSLVLIRKDITKTLMEGKYHDIRRPIDLIIFICAFGFFLFFFYLDQRINDKKINDIRGDPSISDY